MIVNGFQVSLGHVDGFSLEMSDAGLWDLPMCCRQGVRYGVGKLRYGKSPFLLGKSSTTIFNSYDIPGWLSGKRKRPPFSIAMLVYQRVR